MYCNHVWCASSEFEPAAAHQIGSPSRCTWLLSPGPRNRRLPTPSVICIALQPSIKIITHWAEVFLADRSNTLQHFLWKTGVKNLLWFYWHLHVSSQTLNGVNKSYCFFLLSSRYCFLKQSSRFFWAMSTVYTKFPTIPQILEILGATCVYYSYGTVGFILNWNYTRIFPYKHTTSQKNTIQRSKFAVKWSTVVLQFV
jgi:hypothetical protein